MVERFPVPHMHEDPDQSSIPSVLQPGGALYAFAFPNFRLFFFGQLVSVAGTWMQQVAQQWLVYDLTHSSVWLGIVAGSSALPYVFFAFWGGSLADRIPRRTILICTQSISMVLALLIALLATNRLIPLEAYHIALIAGMNGVINAFNMPAQQAFVTEMVDDPKALQNAIALSSLRFNLARFVGPMLAGIALVKLGAAWCFLLNGLSYIAVLISLFLMQMRPMKKLADTSAMASPWEGARFLLAMPSLFRVTVLTAVASLLVLAVSTLYPVLANEFHNGASGFSTLVTVNGIGATLGGVALVTLGNIIPRRYLVYGGATLFSVALLVLSFLPTFTPVLVCLFFGGIGMVVFTTSTNTKIQSEAPDELRGRVMAMFSLIVNALIPLGGLLLGSVAVHLHVQPTIRWAALLTLCTTLAIWGVSIRDRAKNPPVNEPHSG